MSDARKISESHRRRRAVVYVRESSPGQVAGNLESAARQYALRERALALGWPLAAISVVDEDTGRSGAGSEERVGFTELVAEVGLGQVGLILALEVSRLARSSADWHRLLELCVLTGTLIADQDGIYAPSEFNDRLLLGLKGTMSEAELHLIRARLDGGLRNKTARGELRLHLPVGFDRDERGQVVLSPDEQVRAAIEHVFALWRRLGSARQVLTELVAEGCMLPRRTVGERRVRWVRASYPAVHDVLTNPVYAGAFAFGRTRREASRRRRPGAGAAGRAAAGGVGRLPARSSSGLCRLGRVPGDARAAAGEHEVARRGWRCRARGSRAAAGSGALRATDAGCLLGQRRPLASLLVRARPRPPRRRDRLPGARRPPAGPRGGGRVS